MVMSLIESLTRIKNAVYGREVREAIHDGVFRANKISDGADAKADKTQIRQDAVEAYNDQMIQEMTDKDVISAPEIIQARNGSATLADRLDSDFVTIDGAFYQIRKSFAFVEPTMSLYEIQQVLINYKRVIFQAGIYEFDLPEGVEPAVIDVQSGTHIIFDRGAKIRLKSHTATSYKIINIENKEDVKITGANIDGSRDFNAAAGGEWGMGISVRGSNNVVIEDTKVVGCWGDGLYIGSTSTQPYSQNVTLTRFKADNNRRQGISVISVKGLRMNDVELSNTNGTAPEAGIDFEPNNSSEIIEDVYINNLRTSGNNGNGFMAYLHRFYDDTSIRRKINIIVDNYKSVEDGNAGITLMGLNAKTDGEIVFNYPVIKNSSATSISVRSKKVDATKVVINRPTIINANTSGTDGTTNGSAISIFRSPDDFAELGAGFVMGGIEIHSPTIEWEDGHIQSSLAKVSFHDHTQPQPQKTSTFSEIVLSDLDFRDVNNYHLLNNSDIRRKKPLVGVNWPGETPVTREFPLIREMYSKYVFYDSKVTIAQLRSDVPENISYPVVFESSGGGQTYWSAIRPPAGERLYPREYSTALGKGIMLKKGADKSGGLGASVELVRESGRWTIKNMVGDWEAEV